MSLGEQLPTPEVVVIPKASGMGTTESQLYGPCPHTRPDWRMCPHCLGLDDHDLAYREG